MNIMFRCEKLWHFELKWYFRFNSCDKNVTFSCRKNHNDQTSGYDHVHRKCGGVSGSRGVVRDTKYCNDTWDNANAHLFFHLSSSVDETVYNLAIFILHSVARTLLYCYVRVRIVMHKILSLFFLIKSITNNR